VEAGLQDPSLQPEVEVEVEVEVEAAVEAGEQVKAVQNERNQSPSSNELCFSLSWEPS
jgi:hypothetical protein